VKRTALFALPTPPPFSGPEVVAELLLRTGLDRFRVCHVQSSVHAGNRAKGVLTPGLVLAALGFWWRVMVGVVRERPAIVYFFLSQNLTGIVRDILIIGTARLSGAAVVAHVHGGNFEQFFSRAPRPFQRLIRWALGACRMVILSGRTFERQFSGLVPGDRLRVVWNPVDVERFPQRPSARPAADCRIVFVGHLSVAKGFGDVLCAVPRVLDELGGASFDFIGEWLHQERNIAFDERGRQVAHRADDLARSWAELNQRYPGRLRHRALVPDSEKIEVIAGADLFVLPSYSEGFPIAVLEAMAAGLPMVLTPVGALPEVLSERHAVFVEIGDSNALAEAIIALAYDPERRVRLGQANRELAATQFAPRQVARSLDACFVECLS
jgi:glycosyltransferase involved in cell wall biosynthesis